MADLKTKKNNASVESYLNNIDDPQRAKDCRKIYQMMKEVTGEEGNMWGDSIMGFGSYHYKYESGREGDWFLAGFSNRKNSISVYIMSGFSDYDSLLSELGKHKTGKSCLYINKLDDINEDILYQLIESSVKEMKQKYKTEG
ncbi:DUF1801 domain-containing protein [Gracilimonas sp.]|uniref:DUF1801 domain-containing protein n=1 Tax=Gracilimonas sp. TaxID=1974203 RepID=UPI0028723265|nr:DUF1801 domain-containing protein [Gracilimonas sp.]